jgi:hypothetical protein
LKLRTGDIFFIKNKNGSSHCGILYEVTERNMYTLESNAFMTLHRDFVHYLADKSLRVYVYRSDHVSVISKLHELRDENLFSVKKMFAFNKAGKLLRSFLEKINVECIKRTSSNSIHDLYNVISGSDEFRLVLKKNGILH